MPIQPHNKRRYPKNWKQIRQQIQERAGDACEGCGVKNHAVGARDKHGGWHDEDAIHHLNSDDGYALFGDFPKMIRIVCTTAHLDHTPENCDPANLRFWCQRCHLNYDRPRHIANRRHNKPFRYSRKTGQMMLFNLLEVPA